MFSRQENANSQQAAQLDQAAKATIEQNLANSPHGMAQCYQQAYEQNGWKQYGPMPAAVTHALNAPDPDNVVRASDGNKYTQGANGEWISKGRLYDSKASDAMREELNATQAARRQHDHAAQSPAAAPAQTQGAGDKQPSPAQPATPSGDAAPHPSQTQSSHSEQRKQAGPHTDAAPNNTPKADPSPGGSERPNKASRLMNPDLRIIFESNGDPAVLAQSAQNYLDSPSGQLFAMQGRAAAAQVQQQGAPEQQQAAQAPRVQQSGPSIG